MKSRILVIATLSLVSFVTTAGAQCNMGGHHSMSHAHASGGDNPGDAHRAVAKVNGHGWQEQCVVIKEGYSPSTIVVRKGVPVRLNFDLQEKSCTGTVVIPDLDIRKTLVPFAVTAVEFTPRATGSFAFSCPMNMIHGTLIVEDEAAIH